MAMVTEMRLRGVQEGGTRFNYKGMHRYLVTFLAGKKGGTLADRQTVIQVLTVLREVCRDHSFDLYAYSFLPERLVMIVRGKTEEADMKEFLSVFRARSSAALEGSIEKPVWARKYQERVLRKVENTRAVAEEVFRLPVKAGLAPRPGAYEFQGSFVLPTIEPSAGRTSRSLKHRLPTPRRGSGRPPRHRHPR